MSKFVSLEELEKIIENTHPTEIYHVTSARDSRDITLEIIKNNIRISFYERPYNNEYKTGVVYFIGTDKQGIFVPYDVDYWDFTQKLKDKANATDDEKRKVLLDTFQV